MAVENAKNSGGQLMIVGSLTVQFTLLLEFESLPSFLSLLSVYLSTEQELATASEEPDQTI